MHMVVCVAACCASTQALDSLLAGGSDEPLAAACLAGVARTSLHLGDVRRGRQLAAQAASAALWKECAAILEAAHQLPEAADMYERAGLVEQAASIHIGCKNFAAAQPLMARVASAKVQQQYAKAKEAEGRPAEAVAAYEAAGARVVVCVGVLRRVQLLAWLVRCRSSWVGRRMLLCRLLCVQATWTLRCGCAWSSWATRRARARSRASRAARRPRRRSRGTASRAAPLAWLLSSCCCLGRWTRRLTWLPPRGRWIRLLGCWPTAPRCAQPAAAGSAGWRARWHAFIAAGGT